MHQIRFQLGLRPKTPLGESYTYSAPPDPLAEFKGPTSKGREEKGGEGREGGEGGKGGNRKGGKGKKRKGRECRGGEGKGLPLSKILNTPLTVTSPARAANETGE